MAHLIDSSVVMELERRNLGPGDVASIGSVETAAIASITASDPLHGVLRSAPGQRRERRQLFVEAILGAIPIVPFNGITARVHARTWANLLDAGMPIGPNDLLIAATAFADGYAELTDDVREVGRVPGLVVHQPAWPT